MATTLIALRIPNVWLERIDAEGPRKRSKVILRAVDAYLNTEEVADGGVSASVVDVPAVLCGSVDIDGSQPSVVVAEAQRTCPTHGHAQGFLKAGGWWCMPCGRTY